MKNLKLLILFCFNILSLPLLAQVSTGQEQEFDYGIKNNSTQTVTNPTYLGTVGTDGTYGKMNRDNVIEYLEFDSAVNLPVTGVAGKIYVTKDNGKIYRWNGTYYAELAITDISGKVDKVTGKSLLSDTEITRLATVTNQDISGKENAFSKNTAFNKNFGIAASTVAEGNDSRITNGQTAFSWGNHAGLYPLYNGIGAMGTWNIDVSGKSSMLNSSDNRMISPSEYPSKSVTAGFTTWNNNNAPSYADFLHFRGYSDSSGGFDNLVMFRKDNIGMRIWQQEYGSTSIYSNYKDVAFTDGSNSSGTWGINISGNAASASTSTLWGGLGRTAGIIEAPGYIMATVEGGIDAGIITLGTLRTALGLGSNAYTSNSYLRLIGNEPLNMNNSNINAAGKLFNGLNTPNGGEFGTAMSYGFGAYSTQFSANQNANAPLYFRVNGDGGLGTWRKLWHDGNFNPANYLPLSGGTLSGTLTVTDNVYIGGNGGTNIQFLQNGVAKWISGYVPAISAYRLSNGITDVLTLYNDGSSKFSGTVTASPATLPNHAVVKSQLDAAVGNSTSGDFPATVTNMVNVADFFINSATYTKIGNIVNAYVSISINPSASGKSTFNLPLPIARQQTSNLAIGSGSGSTYNNIIPIYILSNSTTTALVTLYSPPPTNISINIHFQYDITK